MKNLLTILLFLIVTDYIKGQDPQVYFNLNQNETGTKNYIARDYIKLLPGFHYTATSSTSFDARIDESITYPTMYQDSYASAEQTLDKGLEVGSLPGSFDVSSSGGATYTIPIELPAGLDGMQPNVSITYNSQSGNGLVGWGCNLGGISSINRVPQDYYFNDYYKGVNLNTTDRFALDGNRLMTTGNYGASGTTYNTLMNNFGLITSFGSSPDYFEVETKDGRKLKYGSATGKLIVNSTKVAAWYLDAVEDVNGNYITYEYEQDGLAIYLKKITYGLNKNNADGVKCEVMFTYELRNDPIPLVVSTQSGSINKILGRISTYINQELQASYDFNYSKDVYSRLKSVTRKNKDQNQLNPTIFSYGSFKGGVTHALSPKSVSVSNLETKPVKDQIWLSGDRDGDGKHELMSTYPYDYYSTHQTYLEARSAIPNSTGGLSYTSKITSLPPEIVTSSSLFNSVWKNIGQRVMSSGDFNGDGISDFMSPKYADSDGKQAYFFWCYQLTANGYSFLNVPYLFKKNTGSADELPLFINSDFNNDGNSDLLTVEKISNSTSIRNANIAFISQEDFINKAPGNQYDLTFNLSSQPEEIFPFDYNNDGLKDLLIITTSGYYIYQNYGGSSASSFSNSAVRSSTTTLKGKMDCIRQGDFNGDGLVDFIYNPAQTSSWYFALNNGNGYFTIKSLPITAFNDKDIGKDDDKDNCLVLDWNNDGLDDVVVFDAFYIWVDDIWSKPWKEFRDYTVNWYASTGTSVSNMKEAISTDVNDAYNNLFVLGDFNGDGRHDLMSYGFDCWDGTSTKAWRIYSNYDKDHNQGLLTGVLNGLGYRTEIEYSKTVLKENYSSENVAAGLVHLPVSLSIVKSVNNYGGTNTNLSYSYKGASLHPLLGFLGFTSKMVVNDNTDTQTESVYSFKETASNYYLPYLKSTSTKIGSITNTSSLTYKGYEFLDKSCFIYPYTTTTIDNISGVKQIATNNYDVNNGNVISATTNTYETGGTQIASKTISYTGYFDAITLDNNNLYNVPTIITEVFTLNSGSDGNALSSSTRFTYNSNGTIRTRKTYSGTSKEITSTYNYFSNSSLVKDVTQTNGVESRVTSYLYDNTERFISKITNPLGHTESFTIDLQGNTMVATDPNLKATNNTFNSWNQLIQSETPDASYSYKISWATTGSDIISGALYYTESQRNGLFNGAEYFDCLGRTLRKVTVGFNGAKFYTDTKYNIKGQVEEVTEPYLKGTAGTKKTGYTYLADGRVNTITLPDGRSITKAYPTIGAYHDELSTYSTGEQYYKKYNAAGLLLESSDPGGSIVYAYYKNGKLKSATAGGTTVGIRYDLYGRQQFLDDPDAGTIQYDYNAWDELTSQIQGDNNTIMTYDKLGRMLTKAINGIVTTYKYDPANAIGMIESITKGTTSGVYYKYDNLLNMTEEKCKEGSDIFTFNYEYDLSKNRLTKKIYPGGFAVSYEYNSYDDVTQIKNAADNSSIWTLNEVNSKGQLSKATYGNAKQITYGYDTKDRLNRIYVPGVIDFSYVFNDMNQLDWRDEKYYVNNQYQYFHERFTYDEVNRLSQVYHKLGTLAEVLKLSMDYSAPGNDRIVTKSDVGTFTYSDLTNHQVTGLSSSTGYLPTNHSYSYTSTGKISYIGDSQGNDLSIIYNVLNQRFIQFLDDGGDNLTRYYFNDYEKEIIAGQTRQLNYVYAGGNLVAIFTQEGSTTTPYYIYTDYLGSLRSITDGSGTVLQMLSFDAWGNRRDPLTGVNYTSTPQGLLFARGFTGHEHNDIMGLINMNGRFYDPALGLFISPDNFIQAPDFSQNFNRYAYAFNNPLLYTDPTGEWFGIDDAISAGVGFIVGYVTYGASTGNWGGKAVAAGGMGATVAWLGWNTMGAGLAALPAGGAGSATSFSAGMTAVFGSASGSYGLQFAALTALNVIPNSGDINKADEKGWNGVWAMGGFMTGSVLSTSLKPLSIGAKQGGLGLRQFAGVSLTNNLSDNMENGFFNFHSVHVGPVGWDAERHKNNHSDGWGGFYTIGSHGLTGDQQFAMGFETLLGLSLVKSDIYLPKYRRYMCGNGEWKFVNNAREAKIFGNKLVRTSQIGAWSRNILQGLDAYFMLTEQKTTYQHWYSLTHNDDGTLKGW